MESFLATIIMFGGNFAIRGWAFCNGQLLSIAQNTALFSLLGTTYGGNGQTTFGLPDLRGRSPLGWGQGPGLSSISLGEVGGSEALTLTANNLPSHNHSMQGSTLAGNTSVPTGAVPANTGSLDKEFTNDFSANVAMTASGLTGGNVPVAIRNPYIAVSFLIALEGIYPSRN